MVDVKRFRKNRTLIQERKVLTEKVANGNQGLCPRRYAPHPGYFQNKEELCGYEFWGLLPDIQVGGPSLFAIIAFPGCTALIF